MIMIIGTTEDDILYFKTQMDITSTEILANHHEVYIGQFFGQEICLTTSHYSNSMAAMISGICLEKYRPYIVIIVGSVHGFDEALHQGDLLLTERVYLGQTDFTPLGNVKYGQISGMPIFFHSEDDYLRIIESLNKRMKNSNIYRGSVLATNHFFVNREKVITLINHHFASVENLIALDTELGGIASACHYYDVPWLSIKSVNYVIGHDNELINFIRKGLEAEPAIGSLIGALFTELGTHN